MYHVPEMKLALVTACMTDPQSIAHTTMMLVLTVALTLFVSLKFIKYL